MRVAFLSVSSQAGGSEAVLLQLIRELSSTRSSWDLHLVVPGAGPLADGASALGAQVTHLPMPSPLRRLGESTAPGARALFGARFARAAAVVPGYQRALAHTLAVIEPDVVHSNGIKSHITSARVGSEAPLVWHLHEYVGARPVTRTLLRRYAGRCAAIVANSESVAEDASRALQPAVAIRTVHNGVDLERFSPLGAACDLDAPAGLGPAAPGTVRAGLIATFARWKGHDTFLRAIAALPAEVPVRGYVIGAAMYDTDGSQHTEAGLRALAADLGIQDRVGFTGFVPAVEEAIRALDVVVHASTSPEPFGLVIAEAMACGRALISSATGGAAELVEHDVDALTCAPGDHRMLSETIARVARDRDLRFRIGAAARRTACRRFDAHRVGEEFAGIYEAAAPRAVRGNA